LDLQALEFSPRAGNYEPLQAMVKSGYLSASAQRSPLEFIFDTLLGMVESCKFDFLQFQLISLKHEHYDLMKDQLAEKKNSELSTLHSLLLSSQHQMQRGQTKETFFREQARCLAHALQFVAGSLLAWTSLIPSFSSIIRC
jgi:hypothetical protein